MEKVKLNNLKEIARVYTDSLKNVPSVVFQVLYDRFGAEGLDEIFNYQTTDLDGEFYWDDTEEGSEFWSDILQGGAPIVSFSKFIPVSAKNCNLHTLYYLANSMTNKKFEKALNTVLPVDIMHEGGCLYDKTNLTRILKCPCCGELI